MVVEPRNLAPIALFVYRRTHTLGQMLDALERCPEFAESKVYVFSDGPKTAEVADDVANARRFLRQRLRPNMTLIESVINVGCDNSIIQGVNSLCAEHGRVIVIEDDLIVSPVILTWFNAALDRYAAEPRVMQVSGHMFDTPRLRGLSAGLFLPFTTSWGWATWQRAWDQFEPDVVDWERIVLSKDVRRRFDLGGRYPYFRMLHKQILGQLDLWDIRWYWSVFRRDGVCLFPPESLVVNIGADSYATHGSVWRRILERLRPRRHLGVTVPSLPDEVSVNMREYTHVARSVMMRRI
jgi:hypothetical protein